jgi:hypothetical protein
LQFDIVFAVIAAIIAAILAVIAAITSIVIERRKEVELVPSGEIPATNQPWTHVYIS